MSATDLAFLPPSTQHQPEEEKGLRSTFLFVDNSDKETAARLRNVLTNRKQKMSRVAELDGERKEYLEAKSFGG
jgi:hypothetical protein